MLLPVAIVPRFMLETALRKAALAPFPERETAVVYV